jgi:hypothetical protein
MSALELHATGAVESVSAELLLCGTTSGGYTAMSCLACMGDTDWLCVGGMSCPGMPCWETLERNTNRESGQRSGYFYAQKGGTVLVNA